MKTLFQIYAIIASVVIAIGAVSCKPHGNEPEPVVKYAIDLSVESGEGSLTATVDGKKVTEAEAGAKVTITATADEGYRFVSWSVDGDIVELGKTSNLDFTMPEGHLSISATFAILAATYAIDLSVESGEGSIIATIDGEEVDEAEAGAQVTVTAVAGEGYHFDSWIVEDDVVELEDTFNATFTMPDGDVSISVVFAESGGEGPQKSTLYVSNLVQHGTIRITVDGETTTGTTFVEVGKTVEVEVVDIVSNYEFGYWHLEDPINGYYFDELMGDTKYENPASFVMPEIELTVNVILNEKGGKVTSSVNDAAMGKVRIITYTTAGDEHNNDTNGETYWPVYEGRRVKFIAEPTDGYRLREWSDAVGFTPSSTTATTLETVMPIHNIGIKANFEVIPVVKNAVNFSQITNGAVEVRVDGQAISSGDEVQYGKTVSVKAIPADRFDFKEWSGATFANKNAAETTFVMPGNAVTLNATFVNASYTLNFSAGVGGSIVVTVDGVSIATASKIEGGKTVSVRATVTDPAFAFAGWSGAGVTFADPAALETTFEMPWALTTISAEFESNAAVEHASVLIGGLEWCTVNVAAPGKFAESETDPGMFYQWGVAVGYTKEGVATPSTGAWRTTTGAWGTASDIPDTWGNQDPCPKGWRLPVELASASAGAHEFTDLMAATICSVVNGAAVLTDRDDSSKQLVFPLPGLLGTSQTWSANISGRGYYWSDSKRVGNYTTGRRFSPDVENTPQWNNTYNVSTVDIRTGHLVRCVKK